MREKIVASAINGIELKCKFAFAKNYFTKNYVDVNERVFYDIGFLAEISWENVTNVTPRYTLSTKNPFDITSGISMVRGQIVFKIFHRDSLEALKTEIAKGINEGRDKIVFPLISDNPFESLEDYNASLVMPSHQNAEDAEWGDMPLFDIILIAQSKDHNYKSKIFKKEIKGVRFESNGFAEGIDSLELNSLTTFLAIGELTDWEEVTNK